MADTLARALVLLVLALNVGCARSIAARGTGWWRVTTDHVRLETDVDRDRAITAGWAFEDLYRALAHVFPVCTDTDTGEPIEVVMIARGDEYDAISPNDSLGVYLQEHEGLVSVPARLVVRAITPTVLPRIMPSRRAHYTQVFVHELTHRFVAACFPAARTWLNEGLAKFFETLQVRDEELVVGIEPYHFTGLTGVVHFVSNGLLLDAIGTTLLRPASRTLASSPDDFYRGGSTTSAYASAWALVHMGMLSGDTALRDDFAAYLAALHAGRGERTHWDTEPVQLDAALRAYIGSGHLRERHVPYTPPAQPEPAAMAMSEGQAHLLLATFGLRGHGGAPARRDMLAHLAFALADPSTHATAELLRLEVRDLRAGETESSILAALVEAYPTDVGVLEVRARHAIKERAPTNEARAVLDALAAHAHLDGPAVRIAMDLALVLGDEPSAAELANAQLALHPGDPAAYGALARALDAAGDSEGARHARARALAELAQTGRAPPLGATPEATDTEFDWDFERSTLPSVAVPVVDGPDPAPTPFAVSADGTITAGVVQPGGPAAMHGASCRGFVPRVPSAVIDVPEGAAPFVIAATAYGVTLMVESTDAVACDADHAEATVLGAGAGRMRIFVGSRVQAGGNAYTLVIGRAPRAFVEPLSPPGCTGSRDTLANVDVGMRVRLGRHRPWTMYAASDPVRDEDWAPAMDAFVGHEARVTALAGYDSAGCQTVHVDADRGHWLWRVRDLHAP